MDLTWKCTVDMYRYTIYVRTMNCIPVAIRYECTGTMYCLQYMYRYRYAYRYRYPSSS